MVGVATTSGHGSRDVRQVEGRSEGEDGGKFLLRLKILKERQDMVMVDLCKVGETSQKANKHAEGLLSPQTRGYDDIITR